MNKLKLFAIGFVLAGGLSAQTNQCEGITKDSNQCKNTIKNGNLCHLHNPNYVKNEETKAVICASVCCMASFKLNVFVC